jgi:membrane-associated phospholipid phosphatase
MGPATASAQEPAEPPKDTSSTAQAAGTETLISPREFAGNILRDQKPVFTFPWRAVHGDHWKPVLAVVAGTAALVVLDPHTEGYFHDRSTFSSYKTGPLRGRNTTLAEVLTPVAFYIAGAATHSTHSRNTGLLAAEAIVDTQILSFVMKHAVGRLVPSEIPPHGNLRDTWFKYKGTLTNGGGFPSGHAASAFAVATVVADRYRQHRWVPVAAYGAAAFLALTRLPAQAHFPSDIFIGAALGYSVSHFVVLGR